MILDSEKTFSFKKKTQDDYPNFTQSVDHLQIPDLEANLERFAKYLEELVFKLKHNQEIKDASAKLSLLRKPYNDKINFYKGKTRELNKFIDDGVADKVALTKALAQYNKLTEREKFKRDQDEELQSAKEELNELKAGINDSKKVVEVKIKYLNILILEKEPEQGFENAEDQAELKEYDGDEEAFKGEKVE